MHHTAVLLLLTIINATSFFTGDAPQPPSFHGGSCIAAERTALLSFKEGITSDPAGLLTSWRGQDCCWWRGVNCSNQTGHIIGLRLRTPSPNVFKDPCDGNSLLGEVSHSLLSLEHLEHLDLSMNCLFGPNGSFPEFLGQMRNLRYLNLTGLTMFTGRVPPQLGNLSKMQYLSIGQAGSRSQMYSDDITWLTNLRLLQHVSIGGINLSGIHDWPHMLNMIPSLRVISLSGCSLQSTNQSLPYLNLTRLEKLDLSWNTFDHSIATSWFWKATSLKYLNLQANRLSGQFPDALGNMTSLQVLDVSTNWNKYLMMTGNLKNLCSLNILDFSNNEINGDTAVMMGGLPECAWESLQELDFSYNSFTGTLPNLIGTFSSLRRLELSNNNLTGSVPPGIGNLTCLTALDLSNNRFSGSVPSEIGSLINLSSLDLSNNNFSGIVPSEIGALSDLTSLVLSKNNFSGVITETHFAGLKGLKNIDLSSNSLKIEVDSDWLPPFRLESALFSSCRMGPLFPAWLQWQQEITKLDISSTALVDKIPDWFWSTFSRVTYLDMSDNQISGNLPAHLDDMAFEELYLSSNRLTGPIQPFPGNITVFDISNNSFSGTLPSNLEAVELQTLLMYSNQIGGSIPESMCKLQMLGDLDLSSNLLEGGIPQCFENISISYLLLSNNSLSDTFPTFLHNGKSLEFLDLAWNKFYGRIPTWIGELRRLRFVRLSHNTFSGTIPVEITALSYLQYLDLSGNNISGVIPLHLSNLTGMTRKGFMPISGTDIGPSDLGSVTVTGQFGALLSIITKGQELRYGGTLAYFVSIDLSGNSLSGEIPMDITSLDALINLNLSSNHLSGNIPSKIGDLRSLESLDLSQNKLSGEIPSSLSSLTSLSYLNMSYNSLSGRVPSGHQLDTLSANNPALMYIGNNGLCGPPLQKNCSGNGTVFHGHLGSSNREFEPLTFYFGLVLGLVAGLWSVFCTFLFKKTWRIAYFQLFDELFDRIYVYVVVKWASFTRKTDEE
ncbi:unnamed protein product [Triticum turgidum subsp. durum]|uniref:Leucine-rich repeat-containing N-terminal plant-type domain-containing protein n=1 Tax=Triticum turgidum subsp. durum TaxID=4567 RepID=A0A9R0W6M6_TRITD|nr:unnamed protein product [Triticum turgidum subsp. durum]